MIDPVSLSVPDLGARQAASTRYFGAITRDPDGYEIDAATFPKR